MGHTCGSLKKISDFFFFFFFSPDLGRGVTVNIDFKYRKYN